MSGQQPPAQGRVYGSLPERLSKVLTEFTCTHTVKRWVVGFSGGLDSTALLLALTSSQNRIPVCALHINHRLSAQADFWQAHCATVANTAGVEFVAREVDCVAAGKGLEDAARQARYAVFSDFLQDGDCLLLGHHLNDQAETLLLRLMRGAGPKGLAAMAPFRPLGDGILFRPLLMFDRRELQEYLEVQRYQWIEDESNEDRAFDRNFLRHDVMPVLAKRWPDFEKNWQTSARLCAEAGSLNEMLAIGDLDRLAPAQERLGHSISLTQLQQWPLLRRNNVLRYWFRTLGVPEPGRRHLDEIHQQLEVATQHSHPQITWQKVSVRWYRSRLYCLVEPGQIETDQVEHQWDLTQPLHSDTMGYLTALPSSDGWHRLKVSPNAQVVVSQRQGGERCRPEGRQHSQTVKRLLQEYALEPWLRDRVPLVYVDQQLAAVGDLWVCQSFAARPGEAGVALRWTFE